MPGAPRRPPNPPRPRATIRSGLGRLGPRENEGRVAGKHRSYRRAAPSAVLRKEKERGAVSSDGGGTMLANFVRAASKTPQVTEATWGESCPPPAYIGPKRCRYSLELMNAFTISDSMKLPPNEFSLVSQKLNPDVSGSRRRYPKYSIVTKAALYSRVFR